MMDFKKILIADDEESIREGLSCILDWKELGCKICGKAVNGKDALEQIANLQPDIVIIDVKMPGMTGLDVMKCVSEKSSGKIPYFIILSGFSDFEYAKTAINYGAKAYLLKPVDEDELMKVVVSVCEEINTRQNLINTSKNAEDLNQRYYLQNMLQSLIVQPLGLLESSKFFSDESNSDYVAVIFASNFYSEKDKAKLMKLANDHFSFFNKIAIENSDNIVVVFKTSNDEAIINCIKRTAVNSGGNCFITKGKMAKGLEGIIRSYQEALSYIPYLFYFSNVPCIYEDIVKGSIQPAVDGFNVEEQIESLVFCMETYNKEKFEQTMKNLYAYYKNYLIPGAETKKNMIYCLVETRNRLSTKYPEREISDGGTFDVVPQILEKTTFEEAFQYMKTVFNNMLENFNFNTPDSVIIKVIAYIKSNYTNDLKLETLGDMFNCNSAYLGKKFKKVTGVQFNTYLDNLRIEDAKEKILHSDLKIYQISKLVGYTNTDYFFLKFKKSTGLTPKEFKLANQKGDEK